MSPSAIVATADASRVPCAPRAATIGPPSAVPSGDARMSSELWAAITWASAAGGLASCARGVCGDDDHRACDRRHHPGQGGADHQAHLVCQAEHRVPRDPLLGREQVRDKCVLACYAPRAQ